MHELTPGTICSSSAYVKILAPSAQLECDPGTNAPNGPLTSRATESKPAPGACCCPGVAERGPGCRQHPRSCPHNPTQTGTRGRTPAGEHTEPLLRVLVEYSLLLTTAAPLLSCRLGSPEPLPEDRSITAVVAQIRSTNPNHHTPHTPPHRWAMAAPGAAWSFCTSRSHLRDFRLSL